MMATKVWFHFTLRFYALSRCYISVHSMNLILIPCWNRNSSSLPVYKVAEIQVYLPSNCTNTVVSNWLISTQQDIKSLSPIDNYGLHNFWFQVITIRSNQSNVATKASPFIRLNSFKGASTCLSNQKWLVNLQTFKKINIR